MSEKRPKVVVERGEKERVVPDTSEEGEKKKIEIKKKKKSLI